MAPSARIATQPTAIVAMSNKVLDRKAPSTHDRRADIHRINAWQMACWRVKVAASPREVVQIDIRGFQKTAKAARRYGLANRDPLAAIARRRAWIDASRSSGTSSG
jgi:hypothetical protein